MLQKELNRDNSEINDRAYELYKKHGFKDGNAFVDWLEAERKMNAKTITKQNKRTKSLLYVIVGILCAILVILLKKVLRQKESR